MNNKICVLLLFILTFSASASENCLEILPDKKDYIVTSQLLRKTIECFQALSKKRIYGAINGLRSPSFALKQNDDNYAIKLFGQRKLYIRQLQDKPLSLNVTVEFFNEAGRIINKVTKKISDSKVLKVKLKSKFDYALISITGKPSQVRLLVYAQ